MIRTAVILAAGKGSRLRPHLDPQLPKGALTIGACAMIERSIQQLLAQGIDHIIVGTGHGADWYDALATRYPVTCVPNVAYATTGSMATLRAVVAATGIQSPLVLVESDLIYEQAVLGDLLEHPEPNCVLGMRYRGYGDEVFIQVDTQDHVVGLTKTAPASVETAPVLVGLTTIGPALLSAMVAHYDAAKNPMMDYEDALIAANEPAICLMTDGQAMEVDDANHLSIAQTLILDIECNDAYPEPKRTVLLNPGPATTSQSVKLAQIVPDICPREQAFVQVMAACRQQVCALASATSEAVAAVFFSGSGTAAVEAMVSSVMPASGHALIIDQGAYGQRMASIAQVHGLAHTVYSPDPVRALPVSGVESYLESGQFTHVFVVHHETSTGLLNDVAALGLLCAQYKVVLGVDGMSAFGAVPVDLVAEGIAFYAASSNKNIQGMAGLGFVVARTDALQAIQAYPKRSLYLDLYSEYAAVAAKGQCRFTPPVQCAYAFRSALRELRAEGVGARYARYQALWRRLYDTMLALGFEAVVAEADQGYLITAYRATDRVSDRFDFDQFHDYLYRRGITVYPGQLPGTQTFRLATIGDLTLADIDRVCEAIQSFFKTVLV